MIDDRMGTIGSTQGVNESSSPASRKTAAMVGSRPEWSAASTLDGGSADAVATGAAGAAGAAAGTPTGAAAPPPSAAGASSAPCQATWRIRPSCTVARTNAVCGA